MLEVMLCSLVTLLPDYLFRRFVQGKRITFYSVWFELRWGIVTCLMLTVTLLTVVFYFHPATQIATLSFRTVPIVPEVGGRVAEVYVRQGQTVEAGAPLVRLDSAKQESALTAARAKIAEIEAEMTVARVDLQTSDARIREARANNQQAQDELQTKQELKRRNDNVVSNRELERLENTAAGAQAALAAAIAQQETAQARIAVQLPAAKASAEAALAQAQVELDKTMIRAGIAGHVEQFAVRVGDLVNPFMRPAGVLIPADAGRRAIQAAFTQIEAPSLKVGMIGEVSCLSKPWTIIPVVVTDVQDFVATGQFRTSDQLVDLSQAIRVGSVLVFMEPLYEGGFEGLVPGSNCSANAYSNHHDEIASGKHSALGRFALHAIDATGVVHAAILRIQAIMAPIKVLVLSGH